LCIQHLRVRNGRACVVANETIVEGVILASGEVENALIEREPFVPKPAHSRTPADFWVRDEP
jgi:hypothetical protein